MATLRDIKVRINGFKNTAKITQAMKMVAASRMNRAQSAITSIRPYVDKMGEVLSNVISSLSDDYSNDLLKTLDSENHYTIIVVSADKGLCGAFNTNLFKKIVAFINKKRTENPDFQYDMITIGKKGTDFFKKRDYNVSNEFLHIFNNLSFDIIDNIVKPVKFNYINGKTDRVLVFYNEFVSVIKQDPKYIQLLPVEPSSLIAEVAEIESGNIQYIYEPDQADILDDLLPKLVDILLWKTLLDSNAAEQAARMFAMDNATTNANELISHLNLVYNQERQASITTEMLEIVSGANALQDN